jgi:O-methyltransferase
MLPSFAAELLQAVLVTDHLEGHIIECGTYKGGSTILIAHVLDMIKSEKRIYACDTFEGHPYDDIDSAVDYHRAGRGRDTNVSYVRAKFQKFGGSDRITIVKGKFEDTLLGETGDKTLSLAFLDCDLYDSAKFCYSFLYPRIVHGGCIVVHDYIEQNKERIFGISLATDEFLHEKGLAIKRVGSSAHIIWIP